MPVARIPLVGSMNQRGVNAGAALTAAQDQRFINAMFDVVDNTITGKRTVYVNKRPGFKLGSTFTSGGRIPVAVADHSGFSSLSGPCIGTSLSSFPTTYDLYIDTTSIGSTSTSGLALPIFITRAIVGGEETYLISISSSAGFFVGTTGMAGGTTFTADTVNTNTTLSNVSSTTGLVIGQALSGTGIATGARIQSIGATSLVMTLAATATNSTVTITRERMSKIIATNFPVPVGPMVELNGFVFVAESATQYVWNSPLNSITAAWSAASKMPVDDTPGNVLGVARVKDSLLAYKTDAIQMFVNNGNPGGSVLKRVPNSTRKLGVLQTTGVGVVDDIVAVVYAGVYLFIDGQLVKVSTDTIDRVIVNTSASNVKVTAFQLLGKYFVLVQMSNTASDPQFLYDVATKTWTEFAHSYVPRISSHLGYAVYTGVADANVFAQHYFPWISTAQTPVYQDDAAAYTMTIQTSKIDHGTDKRKIVHAVRLISDVQASGTATLTCSDDDYATQVTLGTFDMTSLVKKITRCGSYRGGRSYRITHSANTAFRAEAIEIEFSVGTS